MTTVSLLNSGAKNVAIMSTLSRLNMTTFKDLLNDLMLRYEEEFEEIKEQKLNVAMESDQIEEKRWELINDFCKE